MAVTQGHGNPHWTRDETFLALDLYFALDGKVPSPRAPEVNALSEILRSLPYHAEAARQPTFRNPDGVGFKLMNIRQVATGKGLGNVSNMDRLIWAEFGHRPEEVHQIAAAIKTGINAAGSHMLPEIEQELPEGRLLTALHMRRERNPQVRKMLLNDRRPATDRGSPCAYRYGPWPARPSRHSEPGSSQTQYAIENPAKRVRVDIAIHADPTAPAELDRYIAALPTRMGCGGRLRLNGRD